MQIKDMPLIKIQDMPIKEGENPEKYTSHKQNPTNLITCREQGNDIYLKKIHVLQSHHAETRGRPVLIGRRAFTAQGRESPGAVM
jgi:hypothetical protein